MLSMIRVGLGMVILIPLSVPFSYGMVAMRLIISLGITTGKFRIPSRKQVT